MFNVWGTGDLLNASYQGFRVGLEPGQLGAAYFIVIGIMPLLFMRHGSCFGSCSGATWLPPRRGALRVIALTATVTILPHTTEISVTDFAASYPFLASQSISKSVLSW